MRKNNKSIDVSTELELYQYGINEILKVFCKKQGLAYQFSPVNRDTLDVFYLSGMYFELKDIYFDLKTNQNPKNILEWYKEDLENYQEKGIAIEYSQYCKIPKPKIFRKIIKK